MFKGLKLEEIIKSNPQIDESILKATSELLSQIRQRRLRRPGYHLVPPYAGRRIVVGGGKATKARTVHVGRPLKR